MKKSSVLIAIVVLIVGAAACSKSLTPQEYFTQLAAINEQASQELDDLETAAEEQMGTSADPAQGLEVIKGFIEGTVTTADAALKDVEALSPPADVQEAHDALVTAMTDLSEAFHAASTEVNGATAEEFEAVLQSVGEPVTKATTAVADACEALQEEADTQKVDVDLGCQGGSGDAMDKAAQSSLRNGVAAARTLFTDNDDFSAVTVDTMAAVEPALTYVEGTEPSTGPNQLSIYTDGDQLYASAALSEDGTCFLLRDDVTAEITFGSTTEGECTGEVAAAEATAAAW